MLIVLALAGLSLHLARRKPPPIPSTDPDMERLAPAIRAYRQIQQRAFDPPTTRAAVRGAIEGLVEAVDEYSVYIPPDKAERVAGGMNGEAFETGLRCVVLPDGRLGVAGVLPGSPAAKAGLSSTLCVVSVNGTDVKFMTAEEVRQVLQGGQRPVEVRVMPRKGGPEEVYRLKPAAFDVDTVTGTHRAADGRWVHTFPDAPGIAYLRVTEFAQPTPAEFHQTYQKLDRPRGLVLDLRGNPGGRLDAAVEIADRFIDEGLIVRTVSRHHEPQSHVAHESTTYPPVPMVVLVDEETASAAEIVAGALQARGRAVLVGMPTRGKWSIQSTFDLGEGLGQMYVTTGRYLLPERPTTRPATATETAPAIATATAPAGEERLLPDVPARLTDQDRLDLRRWRMLGSLKPQIDAGQEGKEEEQSWREEVGRNVLRSDLQLARALKVLAEGQAPATTRPAREPEDD